MDLKIASTKEGITAIQADIKTCGIPLKVITESVQRSTRAKNQIIDIMMKCIKGPRQAAKDCWPVTKELKVDLSQRSKLIGPGGINLKKIFLQTGAQLNENETCVFNVFAPSQQALDEAQEYIKELLKTDDVPSLEFGGIYTARIVEMKENGVMVKLYDSMKPTLIHVAQLDNRRVSIIMIILLYSLIQLIKFHYGILIICINISFHFMLH